MLIVNSMLDTGYSILVGHFSYLIFRCRLQDVHITHICTENNRELDKGQGKREKKNIEYSFDCAQDKLINKTATRNFER